jgi:hypothetical protein
MRKLLCILAGLMVTLPLANAEVLFYKGPMKTRRSGDGADSRQTFRTYLLLDHASGAVGRINFYPAGSFYSIEPDQVLSTNLLRLPNGKTGTVLASARTDQSEGQTVVSSAFARGNNTRLQVAHNACITFPRTFDWNSRNLVSSGDPLVTDLLEETGLVTLDDATTVTSNNKSETLADAKARVTRHLESLGYREIIVK